MKARGACVACRSPGVPLSGIRFVSLTAVALSLGVRVGIA